MGRKVIVCVEVLNDHEQYTDLLLLRKQADSVNVKMEVEPKDRKHTEVGKVDFEHNNSDKGYLECRQNLIHRRRYSFNIFVKTFMQLPLFRFDSSGGRHWNPKNEELSLPEKAVKTPHFQKFNKDGISIAYRTEYLEENEEEILNDIQTSLHGYCNECNLETNIGGQLTIIRQINLLDYLPPNDPHSDAKFE